MSATQISMEGPEPAGTTLQMAGTSPRPHQKPPTSATRDFTKGRAHRNQRSSTTVRPGDPGFWTN